MKYCCCKRVLQLGLIALISLAVFPAYAQWSADPGSTVRNAFGPVSGRQASMCRGACGGGCPSSCERAVTFECQGSADLRRVVRQDCGTHTACRAHDDCLDNCIQNAGAKGSQSCQSQCDASVVQNYDPLSAASWLVGQGPFDGRIAFEYTRDAPDALEAAYRCPSGTQRQCTGEVGCVAADGQVYEPVFDSYTDARSGAMLISSLRSGLICEDHVCTYAVDIPVSGGDSCAGDRCTRFGVEFDYANADPATTLECRTSTVGDEGDFINNLLKQGADVFTSRSAPTESETNSNDEPQDGMQALMGLFGKIVASADSAEDVDISITPLDKDGSPIESERVGTQRRDGMLPVPRSIDLTASEGHLLIPMYQLASEMQPGMVKEKRVLCTHAGEPVFETAFRLRGA